ncbi:MAG TPA: O-antigen ligase family protein [Thermoanaerobaculia bacterium]|nr:O-antigen ligase family protein [Thermoanaerobaculia bacterium]
MTIQKLLFPLLILFALLTSQIAPAYIVFGLLTLLWFLEMRRRARWAPSFGSPIVILAGVQALLLVLSTLFSRDPATSARHLAGVSLLLLLPIGIDLLADPPRARAIFCALGANSVFLSLLGFWQFAHGGDGLENRIRGTLSHTMTFSGLTMAAGCLLLGFAFEGRGRWRWLGLAAAVPLAAVMLTFTRNAYVGTLAALLVYFAVRRPRGLLLLAPAVLAVFLLVPHEIRGRIRSIVDLKDLTNHDRIAMLHAGLRMVADFPLFGLGPEMVKPYYVLYRDKDALFLQVPHLHNNTLQVAAQSGLFAAAAYLALMGLFFARTIHLLRREDRPDRAALLAGALLAGTALFVAGFFEYNWGDTEVEMATLLVLAVPFSRSTAARS